MENNQNQKIIYLSNRSVKTNTLLCFLLSPIAGYIYTRRWKPFGIFSLIFFSFLFIVQLSDPSFNESFAKRRPYILFAALIASVDNALAIINAKSKVTQSSDSQE